MVLQLPMDHSNHVAIRNIPCAVRPHSDRLTPQIRAWTMDCVLILVIFLRMNVVLLLEGHIGESLAAIQHGRAHSASIIAYRR